MDSTTKTRATQPVTIPWWNQEPVGLGDVVAAMTKAVGIKPCGPCEQRRRLLNERLQFGR
jgi:hypothetical protein